MPLFSALQKLRLQLTRATTQQQGCQHFSTAVPPADSLSWLAAQPYWPKFYWQHRNGRESLAACGEIIRAVSPEQASYLLKTLSPGWKLVGANAFSLAESFLFVPRLIWQGTTLTILLHGELCKDARRAIAFIDGLLPARPPGRLTVTAEHLFHTPDRTGWGSQVEKALAAIGRGEMEKVVLARATDLHFSSAVSSAALLIASREANLNCYHFMLATGPDNAFVGSSPERLYHRQGLELRSEALAGTCAATPDDAETRRLAEALLADEKNQRENRMVVDDIRQRLQAVAGQPCISPVEIVRLRKVQHLRRRIACTLRAQDDALCLERLQPTAAVAGLPRQPARQFIREHETFSRGWYAGSVGYLSAGESEFAVALRSAQVTGNRVRLYAGAGIVAGSRPCEEWHEINQKAAGLGSLLGMHLAQEPCPKSK